jgi:hypothetical protein
MGQAMRYRIDGLGCIRAFIAAVALALGAAAPAFGAQELQPDARIELSGHVLPLLSAAKQRAADVNAVAPISLTVVLRRSDEWGFQQFLAEVQDPASPRFRKFLSPAEIAERFGPSAADYRAVQEYFEQHGFTVVERVADRQTLTVAGTRQQAERALSVRIGDYARGDTRFFANDRDPSLPAAIADKVGSIAGLANLARPQPNRMAIFFVVCANIAQFTQYFYMIDTLNGVPTDLSVEEQRRLALLRAFAKCINSQAEAAGYGTQLAVDPPPPAWQGADGTGQTVGIAAFDTFVMSDVADYINLIGLPAGKIADVSRVAVNGGAPLGPDQTEVLLDIAQVLSIAPGAKVKVFDAPFTGGGTSFQTLFSAMINGGVDIITNSFAYCESQTTLADVQGIESVLQTAAAAGISVFNASGDNGSTCLDGSANTVHVPASSPSATAVGGSSLMLGPGHTYGSETWWNGVGDTPPTGQGGFGVSRFFGRPAYQNGHTASANRSVPDVVANADPAKGVVICVQTMGGCPTGELYGGTSAAAPAWAAFTALLNQTQGSRVGNLNVAVYPFAGTDAFHGASALGSDFAHVGLGSPNLARLHQKLTNQATGPVSPSVSQVRAYGPGNIHIPSSSGVPLPIPADGVYQATVVVKLLDNFGNVIPGKTVSLSAGAGSQAVITPPTAVTTVDNGAALFTVTSLAFQSMTLTATDVTDGVVLDETAIIEFIPPPAAGASIFANPTSVLNDGVSTTTITVTLMDALSRPLPGKRVTLDQGGGHSLITGPASGVTDANGQIQFSATNQFSETVTYTALDVTDGNLPVPGSVQVTFSGQANASCVGAPPTAAPGYSLTPFSTGYFAQTFFFGNVNWGGCPGATDPAFATDGSVYIANFRTGDLYRFGSTGGAVSNANQLSNVGATVNRPVFGKDGSLYVTRGATTGNFTTGAIYQIDPGTGAIVRTVASNLTCPAGLAVDPISGDLFFDDSCSGAGSDNPSIFRVSNPNSPTPTVSVYATLPTTPNGWIAFAPDGTLYVVTGYFSPPAAVIRVGGTNTPSPPSMSPVPGVTSTYWVAVGESLPSGAAKSLIVSTLNSLDLVDITTNPPTTTKLLNSPASSGVVGPDGCIYLSTSDTVNRLASADGSCAFAPTNPAPALKLSPPSVTPDPAQGTTQTLVATFSGIAVPAGTPVTFRILGANTQIRSAPTDANGKATVAYAGNLGGTDRIVAIAAVSNMTLVSNTTAIKWIAGQHASYLSLNTTPTSGFAGSQITVTAGLFDSSVDPAVPLAGGTVTFTLGSSNCNGTTNANGTASCVLTLPAVGSYVLNVSYGGTPQTKATTAAQSIAVAAPLAQLAVTRTGSGGGRVDSNPALAARIDCGAACGAGFTPGANVLLVATPDAGSVFGGWSNACTGTATCAVTMTVNRGVTATLTFLNQGSAFSNNWVQRSYVAYYGRPADPAGLAFWAQEMDKQGGSLAAIIPAFGNSAEFNSRYGGLTYTELVTKIYQQLLARDPDPVGLAYYVGELQSGNRTLQAITLDVMNGATTEPDASIVANKVDVANHFTGRVKLGCDYGGELTGVTALTPVVDASTNWASKLATENRCTGVSVVAAPAARAAVADVSPATPIPVLDRGMLLLLAALVALAGFAGMRRGRIGVVVRDRR